MLNINILIPRKSPKSIFIRILFFNAKKFLLFDSFVTSWDFLFWMQGTLYYLTHSSPHLFIRYFRFLPHSRQLFRVFLSNRFISHLSRISVYNFVYFFSRFFLFSFRRWFAVDSSLRVVNFRIWFDSIRLRRVFLFVYLQDFLEKHSRCD